MADSLTADIAGGWEPLAHAVRVRLTARDLNAVDSFAASLGVSRAWFLRRAIAIGAPHVVELVRAARAAGVAPVEARRAPAPSLDLAPGTSDAPAVTAWARTSRRAPRRRAVDLLVQNPASAPRAR